MLMNVGECASSETGRLLSTVAWRVGREPAIYAVEGSVFVGGAVIQWLRDELGIIRSSDEAESIARSVPDSGGVTFVPAFAGLGAPVWDADARGLITGITRGTNRAHIVRAALDSIALQVCDVADAMRDASAIGLTEMRVDGGAVVNDLLMQRQADLLGVPVVRPKVVETTALGAAMLAGISSGVFRDVSTIEHRVAIDRVFEPSISRDQAMTEREAWRRAVQRARSDQHAASN
jgi:glycerol kinase